MYTPDLIPIKQRYLLTTEWVESMDHPAKKILRDKIAYHQNTLDIGNKFLIVERFNNYVEYFQFASPRNASNINNYFINNIDMFERFILYFKDAASLLIMKAVQDQLIKPWRKVESKLQAAGYLDAIFDKESFVKKITPNKLFLEIDGYRIKLTKREIDCARLLFRGKTYREIALSLSLSPRSVESYIESIRAKTNCRNKSELIELLFKNKQAAKIL